MEPELQHRVTDAVTAGAGQTGSAPTANNNNQNAISERCRTLSKLISLPMNNPTNDVYEMFVESTEEIKDGLKTFHKCQ